MLASLIHKTNQLSDVQNLYYLRTPLKGDAAAVILYSLATSAESYGIAWKLLRERFKNKKILTYKQKG